MPVVKIVNSKPDNWTGTKCFIDNREIHNVTAVDFHVGVDELPEFRFEMLGMPDIEMNSRVIIQVSPQSITDAISVLRHELLQHGEIYYGFKASLKSALIAYNSCGLPFEPEEEIAEKILNFMIGEEQ